MGIVRKARTGLKILFALLGGVCIGVVGTIGGVAYVAYKVPSSKLITLVGGDPNAILTEQYQEKSLYQFVMSMVNGDVSFDNAAGLAEVTPLVENLIDKLSSYFNDSFGIVFDKNELMTTSFGSLPNYIFEKLKTGLYIADLIGANESSEPMVQLICFKKNELGEYDYTQKYTISDLMNNLGDIINHAYLREVMTINEGDTLYPFKDTMIKDLDEKLRTTPIKDLIDLGSNPSKVMEILGDCTFDTITDKIETLEVGDVIEDTSNPVVQYLVENHVKITEISSAIGTIPLNKLFVAEEGEELPFALNSVLNKVKGYDEEGNPIYYTLDEINECYEELCIGDIFDYSDPEIDDNKLIKCIPATTKLDDIPEAFNNITIGEAFHDDIYELVDNGDGTSSEHVIKMWEYLLHNPDTDKPLDDPDATDEEKFSGLSMKLGDDFAILTDNMTKNTASASLIDLYEHDVVCVDDPSILYKTIIGDTSGKRVGDYTYAEFFRKLSSLGILA